MTACSCSRGCVSRAGVVVVHVSRGFKAQGVKVVVREKRNSTI